VHSRATRRPAARRTRAAIGSGAFLILAPGVVAGLIPWSITGWHLDAPLLGWDWLRSLGGLMIAAGAAVLITAFARFVVEGLGTPAPVAPTEELVIGGPYRYVRNPMYLAVESCIAGQALLFGDPAPLGYALAVGAAFAGFVKLYEEPALARQFGPRYAAYRRHVPPWVPRLRAYDPGRK
jgi:protein-S-isoprenylcysteine O-methyltransferase Ste14